MKPALALAAILVLLAAGCAQPAATHEPVSEGPVPEARSAPGRMETETRTARQGPDAAGSTAARSDQVAAPGDAALDPRPRLVDVNGALRDAAAEVTVPAGSFALVHMVYDAALWGESEPWDGSAQLTYGIAYKSEGDIVLMHAFGFGSAFADSEDEAVRPHVSFNRLGNEGSMGGSTSSSCSGDCKLPRHESAFLMGSSQGNTTYRIGVVKDFSDVDALWSRQGIDIRADAVTSEAWAGVAVRMFVLGTEYVSVEGNISATFSPLAPVPGPRTSLYGSAVPVQEPGITAVRLYAHEMAGLEEWSYSVSTPGLQGSASKAWLHEPSGYASLATATGLVYPVSVAAQGDTHAGAFSFEAARDFTGASEPTGLVEASYEAATVGHAGISLGDLLGWDVERAPSPEGSTYLLQPDEVRGVQAAGGWTSSACMPAPRVGQAAREAGVPDLWACTFA